MNSNPLGPFALHNSSMNADKVAEFRLERWKMLAHRCHCLPSLQRWGRRSFAALALIALAIASLSGSSAAIEQQVIERQAPGTIKAAPVAQSDDQALKEFLEIYSLGPRQIVKRIEPPRPQGIHAFWARKYPRSRKDIDEVTAFSFAFSDPNGLQMGWSQNGGDQGFSVRELPRFMNMELFPARIEGDPELLKLRLNGDWVYREGVAAEKLLAAIEGILQRELRLRITLSFREVERDVVVVRGRYRYSPLPGRSDNRIEIYGTYLDNTGTGGGGSGSFPEFLRWVGEWIERPVLSEFETPPKETVGWHYNANSQGTRIEQRQDHDEPSVLKHLAEQTGLTYTQEKKPIRVLFVERPKHRPASD